MPQPTTQTRWTQDTRIAFLLALRLTGGVIRAAREIGRKPAVCYKVRERDAGFAAKWDAIVAEQRAARRVARVTGEVVPAPVERNAGGHRRRRDGLTTVKRRAFLRVLTESGSVERACAGAGVSDTAVYNLRAGDGDFAAAWANALAKSGPVLDQVLWERAVEGWEEPVFAGGKQVGTRRKRSDVLLRQLMIKREKAAALAGDPAALVARAKEAAKAAGGFFATRATEEETNAKILAALAVIDAREKAKATRTLPKRAAEDSAGVAEFSAGCI